MEMGLFILLFIIVVSSPLIFKTVKFGGFKAGLFGAKIISGIGEVRCIGSKREKLILRIHELDDEYFGKSVGVEITTESLGDISMIPIVLSLREAKNLNALLSKIEAS